MSSGAGLGQVQLGIDRDGVSLPRRVLMHSWVIWKASVTPAGSYQGLWQDFEIGPISRSWLYHSQCTFFPLQDLEHCFHSSADLVPP